MTIWTSVLSHPELLIQLLAWVVLTLTETGWQILNRQHIMIGVIQVIWMSIEPQ